MLSKRSIKGHEHWGKGYRFDEQSTQKTFIATFSSKQFRNNFILVIIYSYYSLLKSIACQEEPIITLVCELKKT